ncbi:guanosine-3',5'-bis(diphosphate) 3'-pyrophosphohydrolase MESH1 isoform X2 [Temnothorax nylanderi]|uniref:guanosine-3',5'-bis(diphosphate) 3'-pyrophosphohydrolase MESH1 isoform X2 n=1 Tax=Temnothorax nylanderi TaxID=102681 RepID=UPI003A8B066D
MEDSNNAQAGWADSFKSENVHCEKCVKELTKEELLSQVIKCASFAAEKHQNQRRKNVNQTPYINHPLAILHDTVEDTDTTFEEIEKEFGYKVTQVVREVTDDKTLPKAKRQQLQIEHAPNISREAKLVKLADKLYNLRDLEKGIPIGWTSERVKEYFKWAKAVIDGCRQTNLNLERELDILFASHGLL